MEILNDILDEIEVRFESGEISEADRDSLYEAAYEKYMIEAADEMTADEYLDALESSILGDDEDITVDDVMEAVEDGVISKEDAYDYFVSTEKKETTETTDKAWFKEQKAAIAEAEKAGNYKKVISICKLCKNKLEKYKIQIQDMPSDPSHKAISKAAAIAEALGGLGISLGGIKLAMNGLNKRSGDDDYDDNDIIDGSYRELDTSTNKRKSILNGSYREIKLKTSANKTNANKRKALPGATRLGIGDGFQAPAVVGSKVSDSSGSSSNTSGGRKRRGQSSLGSISGSKMTPKQRILADTVKNKKASPAQRRAAFKKLERMKSR